MALPPLCWTTAQHGTVSGWNTTESEHLLSSYWHVGTFLLVSKSCKSSLFPYMSWRARTTCYLWHQHFAYIVYLQSVGTNGTWSCNHWFHWSFTIFWQAECRMSVSSGFSNMRSCCFLRLVWQELGFSLITMCHWVLANYKELSFFPFLCCDFTDWTLVIKPIIGCIRATCGSTNNSDRSSMCLIVPLTHSGDVSVSDHEVKVTVRGSGGGTNTSLRNPTSSWTQRTGAFIEMLDWSFK